MKTDGDMCVAPDESYLIITCTERPENLAKGDLYVSLRREDDTWMPLRHGGQRRQHTGRERVHPLPNDLARGAVSVLPHLRFRHKAKPRLLGECRGS